MKGVACMVIVLLAATFLPAHPAVARPADPPLLAYYYIWFDPGSWDRAKTDYPLLGRYSSDDMDVMRQHVAWAQDAGFDGFIVSWKSTERLNRRLEQLMAVAAEADFKLTIIYQGLDFERRPLPIDRIAKDLDFFADSYADDPVFSLFEKPLIIWSGTWEFSASEVDAVTQSRRDRLFILASERNREGYERLAKSVDGDAYYWSSVDPETYPGYPEKLADMAGAVRDRDGLWIAPAAPGFDARLIGGTRVVHRQEGETLRRQIQAALASSPDAIGLISWNEFSENSHVEPSLTHGDTYLDVIAGFRDTAWSSVEFELPVAGGDFASDEPAMTIFDAGPLLPIGAFAVLLVVALVKIGRRSHY